MDERRGLDCPRVQITQMSAVHPEDGRACVAAAARTVLRAAEQFCAVELTARVRLFLCAHIASFCPLLPLQAASATASSSSTHRRTTVQTSSSATARSTGNDGGRNGVSNRDKRRERERSSEGSSFLDPTSAGFCVPATPFLHCLFRAVAREFFFLTPAQTCAVHFTIRTFDCVSSVSTAAGLICWRIEKTKICLFLKQ